MEKNTPQLWDKAHRSASIEEDVSTLKREENSIRWRRIEKIVLQRFGGFKDLRVIEIGAGVGTYSALMAKSGARVKVLDFSDKALERAREFFKRNNLSAEFVKEDALKLPTNMLGKYDVSMSFGLAEHFRDKDRTKIVKAHFDLLKKGGIAFISVPNKYNPLYRAYKLFAESTGRWDVGEEYPYSRGELRRICKRLGTAEASFIGGYLFHFNPLKPLIKRIKSSKAVNKAERGTFLDQYLSYALVLVGKK